jgi:tetratricopeptide (TPR) repeat protein
MSYLLLLVNSDGQASTSRLVIRELREFPGGEGLSVHFRPVRNDLLFESAKVAGRLAYRILSGEGRVRSQLWVEYEVLGPHVNVTGRSSDLLFALALITSKWKTNGRYPAIAATGMLDADSAALASEGTTAVQCVKHTVEKVAAAVSTLLEEPEALIFYPAADTDSVSAWSASTHIPARIRLHAVESLEDALSVLGISLEKAYLGNPFRGLEHFDYQHRAIFFGRDAEVTEVLGQLLRREAAGSPGLLVEGASGSGKSSFLHAGVLPALVHAGAQPTDIEQALRVRPVQDTVRHALWRVGLLPANADERRLARSILDCWKILPELAGCFGSDNLTLSDLVERRRQCWPAEQRFVWLLDQLEELFTLGLPDPVIDALGRFLIDLQSDGVWTLASIRADMTAQLKQHPSLRQVFGTNEGQYYLGPINATALDDVINRPAHAAGLTFGASPTGRRLDQILREDAYRDRENALPLLQFTLHELYQRRSGRELTFSAYEYLAGLSGSVATAADAILRVEAAESQTVVPRLFRHLVTMDETGRASRRYAPIAEIAEESAQKRVLLRLVEARLCVTDQREGQSVVALAHEALLRTWPALVDWLKEEASLLKARELAERECRLWEQRHRSNDWLATRDKLALLAPLMTAGLPLPGAVPEFIARSDRRLRHLSTLKSLAVASIVVLAVLACAMGWEASRKAREAEYQAAQARRAQLRAETEARTAGATVEFLSTIFDAPAPENSLGRLITARELLDAGAQRLNATLLSAPDVKARLTERIGKAYRQLGEYERAKPLLESAVAQYAALSEALPEDRAETFIEAARLYDATDQHDRARATLIEAARWDELIPLDRRSAMPYILRAEIETAGADFRASQAALERASAVLAARRQTEDRENYELPLHYSRLYVEEGRFADAERFGLEAITAERRILGDGDPSAIGAAINMQRLYLQMQTPARGEPYGRRARDMARAIYGTQHPYYATVLMEYADVLGAMGRPKDAERLMREALKVRLVTLGSDNTATGYSYYNLGNAVADQGRNADALPLIVRSQHIWEVSEGPEHPDVAWALDMEARLLTALGRAAEAIPLAMRARAISQKAYGPEHPNVGRSWMRLGDARLRLGEYRASVEAYQHAVQIFEHSYGPDGSRVGEVLEKYSKALRGAGRSREAVAALARATRIAHLQAPPD